MRMRNVLAVAETPLHLFNLCALLDTPGFISEFATPDLAIVREFPLDESLLNRLRVCGAFRSVTVVEHYYLGLMQLKAIPVTLQRMLDWGAHQRRFGSYLDPVPEARYDCILAGCATVYLMDFHRRFCPEGPTYFYEEGEGSYLGNFVKSVAMDDSEILVSGKTPMRSAFGHLLRLVGGRRALVNARALYLYRPELVESGVYRDGFELRHIAPLSRGTASLASSVFPSAGCDVVEPYGWVYLGNPDGDLSDADLARVDELSEMIAKCCHPVCFRPHPRSTKQKVPSGMPNVSLDSRGSWESSCLSGLVTNESVLFGYGSTAQANPKRMFDLEPTVVCLHRLLSKNINTDYAEKTLEGLVRLYRDKSKVYAPCSLEELSQLLDSLEDK